MFELFCFIEEFIHFCNQAIDFLLYMFYNLIKIEEVILYDFSFT